MGLCFVQGSKGFGSKTVICSCGFLSVISDRDYFALRDLASSCCSCCVVWRCWEGDWVKLETSWSSKIFPTWPTIKCKAMQWGERQLPKISTDTICISQIPAHPDHLSHFPPKCEPNSWHQRPVCLPLHWVESQFNQSCPPAAPCGHRLARAEEPRLLGHCRLHITNHYTPAPHWINSYLPPGSDPSSKPSLVNYSINLRQPIRSDWKMRPQSTHGIPPCTGSTDTFHIIVWFSMLIDSKFISFSPSSSWDKIEFSVLKSTLFSWTHISLFCINYVCFFVQIVFVIQIVCLGHWVSESDRHCLCVWCLVEK